MTLNHIFIGDPSAKKLIIFLHEGLGSIAQWKNFPKLVEKLVERTGFRGKLLVGLT